MHERLRNLIERFREAQDKAVSYYVNSFYPRFGLRLPTSRDDWANMIQTVERGPYSFSSGEGIELFNFGFEFRRLDMNLPDEEYLHSEVPLNECVFVEWGDHGEADGFTGVHLQYFDIRNRTELPPPALWEIADWIKQALNRGDLIGDTHLLYSPLHRARRR